MIILIGGCSGSGKTLLAQKLVSSYHIPFYSIESLSQSGIVLPVIEGIIERAIHNDQQLIFEGSIISADFISNLDEEAIGCIIPLIICFTDTYIDKNIEEFNRDCIIAENTEIKEHCIKYNLDYFELNDSLDELLEEVLEYINSGIFL